MHGHQLLTEILEHDFNWHNKPYLAEKPAAPVIIKGSAEHQFAEQLLTQVENDLIPASSQAKAAILYKLQGHYHQPNMPEALVKEVTADYARLLDGYSAKVMQEACDSFLLNPDQRFFPKVGELKAQMDWMLYRKKRHQEKLTILIGTAE